MAICFILWIIFYYYHYLFVIQIVSDLAIGSPFSVVSISFGNALTIFENFFLTLKNLPTLFIFSLF